MHAAAAAASLASIAAKKGHFSFLPSVAGASTAGQTLSGLPEFSAAKTIKVNPDKPQEEVRYQVLDQQKSLIVPTPRLSKGLFNRLSVPPGPNSKEDLRKLASRHGIDKDSKPVPMASRFKVDLFVVGCVAVDRQGRRLGKGEGYADLEWALAASNHGSAVGPDTLVVTSVHDCQVFDALPAELFQSHDLGVDIIVTPSEIIRVEKPLPKPTKILWNLLTREKFQSIEILTEIQFKEKRAGNDVRLKDEDSSNGDAAQQQQQQPISNNNRNSKRRNNKKQQQQEDAQNGDGGEANEPGPGKRRNPR